MRNISKIAKGILTALFVGTACAAPSQAMSVLNFREQLPDEAQAYALRFALNTEAARGSGQSACIRTNMITDGSGQPKPGFGKLVKRIKKAPPDGSVEEEIVGAIGDVCRTAGARSSAPMQGTSSRQFSGLFPQKSVGSKALRLAIQTQAARLYGGFQLSQSDCINERLVNPATGSDGKPALPAAFLEIVNGIYAAQPSAGFVEDRILEQIGPCMVPATAQLPSVPSKT